MKEVFSNRLKLNRQNKKQLETINNIIDEYLTQGYTLTLRQLYYQLVSRDIVPNSSKEYAKLSKILVKGRMAGVIDWYAIEDRTRAPVIPYWVKNISHAIEDTIEQYRLNRMEGQNVYIEVWVEKDALSGVLRKITSYYHIRLMVNRGYSSCTAMYDAANRIKHEQNDKECYILYLGDHDPSGVDMVRDIGERLEEFDAAVSVKKIALTYEQIKRYNPPPNPTKVNDPRAKEYISRFGNTSWEVDALNPEILNELLKNNINALILHDVFEKMLVKEESDRETLEEIKLNMDL